MCNSQKIKECNKRNHKIRYKSLLSKVLDTFQGNFGISNANFRQIGGQKN